MKVVYTVPVHHNPTGITMSNEKRCEGVLRATPLRPRQAQSREQGARRRNTRTALAPAVLTEAAWVLGRAALVGLAQKYDFMIIADEAYQLLSFEDPGVVPLYYHDDPVTHHQHPPPCSPRCSPPPGGAAKPQDDDEFRTVAAEIDSNAHPSCADADGRLHMCAHNLTHVCAAAHRPTRRSSRSARSPS